MRVEVRKWVALGGAVGILAAAPGAALAQQARKSAAFDMAIVNAGPNGQVTVNVKMWVTPTQARADVKHPLEGNAVFLVSNGFFYQLDPKSKRGVKAPLPAEFKKRKDNFAALMGMFAFDATRAIKMAKKVRTESAAGFPCDVYSNTIARGDVSRTITVWLPQKTQPQFPVKAIMADKIAKPGVSVNQSVSIDLSNVRLNAAMPPSLFTVPAGYKIVTGKPKSARARSK